MTDVLRGLDLTDWRSLCLLIHRVKSVPLENGEFEYKDSTVCIQKHTVFEDYVPALVLVRVATNTPVAVWDYQGRIGATKAEFAYVLTHILSLTIQILTEGLSGESLSLS